MITIEEMKADSWGWKEAFGGPDCESDWNPPYPALPDPSMDERLLKPIRIDDVKEIINAVEGARDEAPWICYGRLKDKRYFFLEAWCDYTGWD